MSVDNIKNKIHEIRGQKVMLDRDLAELYQVETKVLNQAVKRNIKRFPEDTMFVLTKDEFDSLRSQIVTSNKRGGTRYMPLVFTELGIAMLSSVLSSEVAIQANLNIMRAFVAMRHAISSIAAQDLKIEIIAPLPQKTLPFIGIIPKNLLYVKYFRYFAVNTIVF
ncbi:MAG: ORF6N domain-containing protein [Bacteroidales bacterium]|nr:ORF6N domain-containing protein [Bacteroidales bacterium]